MSIESVTPPAASINYGSGMFSWSYMLSMYKSRDTKIFNTYMIRFQVERV